jgi:pimeloyl-ACP methyl ester carboxylesterase
MSDTSAAPEWTSAMIDVRAGAIAAQVAGSREDPAVILLGGATWSRDWWPEGFCGRLVDAGARVIRFDPRDTGESTHSPVGAPDYDADDLTDDVLAVLDHFSVSQAIVVGLSMGGGIAQTLAAQHPSRVSALVLISTSPAYETDATLPPPTPELQATFAEQPADVDVTDREAIISARTDAERPYAGPGLLDEPGIREAVGRTWDRDPDMSTAGNHFAVAGADGPSARPDGVPGIVVHGSADPLFPLRHGEVLSEELGMPLIVLDGVGHQLPPASHWDDLVNRIVALRA